jgi:hypothetical protein
MGKSWMPQYVEQDSLTGIIALVKHGAEKGGITYGKHAVYVSGL